MYAFIFYLLLCDTIDHFFPNRAVKDIPIRYCTIYNALYYFVLCNQNYTYIKNINIFPIFKSSLWTRVLHS